MSYTMFRKAMAILTNDPTEPVLKDADLLLKDNKVLAVGQGLKLPEDAPSRVIEASMMVITPGMVNTHHHLYQTFQRNVPFVQDAKLFDWLTGLYKIWQELTPDAVYVSAQVGLSELLLSGCTTVADHYYVFPKGQPADMLDNTIRAAQELGVRFHPTRGSMSMGESQGGLPPDSVVQSEEEILKDSERVIKMYHDPEEFSMCRIALAPCSPFSVTATGLKEAASLARSFKNVRLHTHLAETFDENDFCLAKVGMRPLDYMESCGWLGPDVWYAHGVHFNDEEIARLAKTGTGVAHCPASNLRLGSGIARVPEMIAAGVPVGLAVDGSASNDSSNMLREAQIALIVHRVGTGVESMPALKVWQMATMGSAKVLGRDDIGMLLPGKAADLAVWDMDHVGYAGALHDPLAALLFCTGNNYARHVFVNGRQVVENFQLTGLDTRALSRRATQLSEQMIQRSSARTGIDYLKHTV